MSIHIEEQGMDATNMPGQGKRFQIQEYEDESDEFPESGRSRSFQERS